MEPVPAQGVKGPLVGVELEVVPVTQTSWQLWRELHPDTKVLDKRGRYQFDSYSGYYSDGSAGVLGESSKDSRLDRKDLVLGVDIGGQTKAHPLGALSRAPRLNDSFAGQDLLVFFEGSTGTALVYDRSVDGTSLTFQTEGPASGAQTILVDTETGTRWLALTGAAIGGELRGEIIRGCCPISPAGLHGRTGTPDTELYEG